MKGLNTKIRNEKEIGERWPKKTHGKHMGRSKACKISGTGQHLECSGRCQGDTVAWFCSWGLFCQAHRTRSGCIRAGGSTLCPRDVLESEDGLGFMSSPQGMVHLWVLLWEQRASCLSHSLVCCRVFPPACHSTLFPVQNLAQTQLLFLSQFTWGGEAAWD